MLSDAYMYWAVLAEPTHSCLLLPLNNSLSLEREINTERPERKFLKGNEKKFN